MVAGRSHDYPCKSTCIFNPSPLGRKSIKSKKRTCCQSAFFIHQLRLSSGERKGESRLESRSLYPFPISLFFPLCRSLLSLLRLLKNFQFQVLIFPFPPSHSLPLSFLSSLSYSLSSWRTRSAVSVVFA